MSTLRPPASAPAASGLAGARLQAAAWWRSLAPRERRLVSIGGWLIGLFIVWSIGIQPALRTLRAAPVQLDLIELQLQQMQQMASESTALRAAPAVSSSQAAAALRSATASLGDQGRIIIIGDRATLTVTGVNGARLAAWLSEARSAARVRPVEAQLTRNPQGYTGNVVVQIGSAP
ncbi:MAG: ral secretion pathway protein GspM [Rhizobacter sp.]|nr:ral secretion pathway protein GspM [Rhizobacter sp.]